MPKMTPANRVLMARDRIEAVIKDTRERVFSPLRRQLGPRHPHIVALISVLKRIEETYPELESWSRAEAVRADAEHAERVEARKAEYAARRKERAAQRWRDKTRSAYALRNSVRDRPERD